MRQRVVLAVLAILVAGASMAWAQTRFSDVPTDHPQADDVAYAVGQGWFTGYPDGTFRPDQALTDRQAVTVFRRAFPDGVTRADLATILRSGKDSLLDSLYQYYRFGNECKLGDDVCAATDADWIVVRGLGDTRRWRIDYFVQESNWLGCFPLEMTVWLVDENGRRTGDQREIHLEVPPRARFSVEVPVTNQNAAGFLTGHTCYWFGHDGELDDNAAINCDAPACYRLPVSDPNRPPNVKAFSFVVNKSCRSLTIEAWAKDRNGREIIGSRGAHAAIPARPGDILTVEVVSDDAYSYEWTIDCRL